MQRSHGFFLSAVLVWLAFGAVLEAATDGRIQGTVKDIEGKPIPGVQVIISAQEVRYQKEAETNKKGKFVLTLLDATHTYSIRLVKEGFAVLEEPIDPLIGGVLRREWVLAAPEDQEAMAQQIQQAEEKDKATKLYNQGALAYQAGDMEGAIAGFQAAAEENPKLAHAHAALARIHLELEEWDKVIPYAERVVELEPEQAAGYTHLYDAYFGKGDKEQARAALAQLEAVEGGDKTAARFYNEGVAAIKAGEYDVAEAHFRHAIEIAPSLVESHLALAQIYLPTGRAAEAIEEANIYVAARPTDSRALGLLFRAHKGLGNTAEADRVFAILAEADPAFVAKEFEKLGTDQFNAGQTVQAIVSFEGVLKAEPANPRALYMLGLCWASNSDLSKAKDYLTRFLEVAPDDPEAETARAMLESFG